MIGLNGIALPAQLEGTLGWLSVYGFSFGNMLTAVGASSPGNVMLWIVVFLLIAVIGRNTDELVSTFKPSYISLILVTALFLVSLYNLTNYSEFIYFRF
ncbi:MAG: hypothetical protein Q8R40_05245 [bacterium]|nr:hypothetical protein [bacterium]